MASNAPIIANPPSYITAADFLNQYHAAPVLAILNAMNAATPNQLQEALNRASGAADAFMKRSLLAREVTLLYEGSGTRFLDLEYAPLIYVRQLNFAQPGLWNIIPLPNLEIDYMNGIVATYMPFLLQGIGLYATFPKGFEIQARFAYGYNYTVANPSLTITDAHIPGNPSLAPGTYDIVVATRTPWGVTMGTAVTYTTTTGQISILIGTVLGGASYPIYIAPHGQQPILNQEPMSVTFNAGPMYATITTLTEQLGLYAETAPTEDTSAMAPPQQLIQAMRLLTYDDIFSSSNVGLWGITKDNTTSFAPPIINKDGLTVNQAQAKALLLSLKNAGVY